MKGSNHTDRLFDKRVVRRNVGANRITQDEYDAFLKALPDVAEKIRPRDEGGDDDGFDGVSPEDDYDDEDDFEDEGIGQANEPVAAAPLHQPTHPTPVPDAASWAAPSAPAEPQAPTYPPVEPFRAQPIEAQPQQPIEAQPQQPIEAQPQQPIEAQPHAQPQPPVEAQPHAPTESPGETHPPVPPLAAPEPPAPEPVVPSAAPAEGGPSGNDPFAPTHDDGIENPNEGDPNRS